MEGLAASGVAGGDAAPILEATEPVVDAMRLPMKGGVVRDRDRATSGGRNAGRDAPGSQGSPVGAATVSGVADEVPGLWHVRGQRSRAAMVAHLPLGQGAMRVGACPGAWR